jgi:hypothetical protein
MPNHGQLSMLRFSDDAQSLVAFTLGLGLLLIAGWARARAALEIDRRLHVNEGQRHELGKSACLPLQIAHAKEMARPVLVSVHIAKHDRGRAAYLKVVASRRSGAGPRLAKLPVSPMCAAAHQYRNGGRTFTAIGREADHKRGHGYDQVLSLRRPS